MLKSFVKTSHGNMATVIEYSNTNNKRKKNCIERIKLDIITKNAMLDPPTQVPRT